MAASRSCLACGYRLDGARRPSCPECGRGFDPDDASSFGVRFDHPEMLIETRQEWIGRAMSAELFDAGILNQVEVAASDIVVFASTGRVRIYVDAEDLPRSQTLMSQRRLDRVADAGGRTWPCPQCGEEVPSSFEVCWSCGAHGEPDRAAADEHDGGATAVAAGRVGGRTDLEEVARSFGVPEASAHDAQVRPDWRRGRVHSLLGGILFLTLVLIIALVRGATAAAIGIGVVIVLLAGFAVYLNGHRGEPGE